HRQPPERDPLRRAQRPPGRAPRGATGPHRLARHDHRTRAVPATVRRDLPGRSGGVRAMSITRSHEPATSSGERTRPRTPAAGRKRSVASAAAQTAGTLLGELLRRLGHVTDRVIEHCEHWLVDAKHARHGLAVTRILLGLTALGLLAPSCRTRYSSFGSGSAWNGHAAAPSSDFPTIWSFSGFIRIALYYASFSAAYVGVAVLAALVVLG